MNVWNVLGIIVILFIIISLSGGSTNQFFKSISHVSVKAEKSVKEFAK